MNIQNPGGGLGGTRHIRPEQDTIDEQAKPGHTEYRYENGSFPGDLHDPSERYIRFKVKR
ncbi:MAG: hypothetical protein Kow00105_04410 [Phycisphaeraceae bacterium]